MDSSRTLKPDDPEAAPYEALRKQNESETRRIREARAKRARGETPPMQQAEEE